jgi:hypothetical protein
MVSPLVRVCRTLGIPKTHRTKRTMGSKRTFIIRRNSDSPDDSPWTQMVPRAPEPEPCTYRDVILSNRAFDLDERHAILIRCA